MDKKELILFIVITTAIIFIFIAGSLLFIFQYRKRKLLYEREKEETERQHKLDLLNAQLQIQQQTMQFIGSEIHDSVAQKLTLASIYTQQMEFENNAPVINDKLSSISKIINDTLVELRQLSKSLTDDTLQNASLDELIEMECNRVNAAGICYISFHAQGLPVIDIDKKSSLLRIVQEFIQNSIKHASCKNIFITIQYRDAMLALDLKDDGKGFDTGIAQPGSGLGNIRRRIQMLEGNYQLHSEIDNGVKLLVLIPLKKEAV